MADALFNTLCAVCHTQPHKYKCPGCGSRTCSASCIQKHKARASCSGERNPAAFMPLPKLRTEAGFDHDYNFLSGIEQAKRRLEKQILEEKGLVLEAELRAKTAKADDLMYKKVWHGEEMHHLPFAQAYGRARGDGAFSATVWRPGDKQVCRRLTRAAIQVLSMPRGMRRQMENQTSFDRRSKQINWQVEWMIWEEPHEAEPPCREPVRVLAKVLDKAALSRALAVIREARRGNLRWSKKEASGSMAAEDEAHESKWRFFLHKEPDSGKTLVPLASTTTLYEGLTGRTVIEFPTIYALAPRVALPDDYRVDETPLTLVEDGLREQNKREAPDQQREAKNSHMRMFGSRGRARKYYRGRGGERTFRTLHFRVKGGASADEGEIDSNGDERLPAATNGCGMHVGFMEESRLSSTARLQGAVRKCLVDYGSSDGLE